MSAEPTPEPCPGCHALEQQVLQLTLERQHLLEQLGRQKARADALYLAFPAQAPPPGPVSVPLPAPVAAEVPLRYQLADALNAAVKRLVPGAHRVLRRRVGGAP